MALTELGFERPTFDDILDNQIDRAKELFGENIDTSELSALGKFIRINTSDIDTLYQTLEGVYYSRFPRTARGVSLDRLCTFAGISRNAATFARFKITIKGTKGAVIPAGFEISTENQSIVYHLIDDYTIGSDGTVVAYVECNEAGTIGNISPELINTIVNPSADVNSITVVELTIVGKDIESDTDLRERFSIAVSGSGSGTLNSIKSAVMCVAGVYDCVIKENATSSTVGNCSPYSFECVVAYDGTSNTKQSIAEAIFSKKPVGISTSGTNSLSVIDDAGEEHNIKFSDVAVVYIYFYVRVNGHNYSTDTEQKIKENIIARTNSLGIGDDVYISKYWGCFELDGIDGVESFNLTRETAYGTANIEIADNEVARTSADRITVVMAKK
jgi:uncharacterized phage protein gp47/JayE